MQNQSSSRDRSIVVRKARSEDSSVLLQLIESLARYEKLTPPDPDARNRLLRDMFSDRPRIEAYLAEEQHQPVGYSLVLETYSSFLALPTLYLEDLFVLPEYRGTGAGFALFQAMVEEAFRRGCGRMEWSVLDWNQLAISFYKRVGARHMREWQLYRLMRADMERILSIHT